MCGICGFNWNDEVLARKMANQIVHRGPDNEGVYTSDEMSLAFRRLSIIDLSENGNQPMFNEDGSVVLVVNGEIYNFQALRHELEQDGYVFRSNADSEVIVHGYEKWGDQILEKLRGMFALAIWDTQKKRLLLARDRIGIKPLYYSFQQGNLLFGSEIKTLLESSRIERKLNYQALYDYLGFEFVPSPETMFAGINKLPAGCSLVYENGKIVINRYWDLHFNTGEGKELSFDEAVEEFRFHLDYAVKSHLVSDVPVGVFLSGGLDSSCIVALMRRYINGPLRTFTIGYEDKSFSELDYAQIVANHCDTEHHVLMLDSLKPEYVEQTLWHLDEPMTDLSTVPLYLLCKQAKEYATVCLSGEGADESLAGYDRFKAGRLDRYFRLIPAGIRRNMIGRVIDLLPDQPQKKGAINMLKRFVEGSNLDAAGQHLRWQYFLTRKMEQQLFTDSTSAQMTMDPFRLVKEYDSRCDAQDEVNRQIYLDMRYMMADSVLMKVDRMSMASSLEIRVPLLDHVLVEFLASLPGSWKLKGMETKHIFRAALEGLLPDKVVHRGKQGYSLPVKHLLRGDLKDYMVSLLNDSRVIRENFDLTYVNQLISEHCAGKKNHNHILWAMMNVAIWHNRFFA